VPFAAAFDWLSAQDGVDPGAVAIIGRSFGGLDPRAMADSPTCLPADLRSFVR